MKMKTVLASLAVIATLTSCEDIFEGGHLNPDGSTPSVTINNPSKNQTVSAATGLRINISAVDKDNVENMRFELRGETAEKAVLSFNLTPGKRIVEFDTTLNVSGIAPGSYELVVSATDKRTNLTVQEVPVKVK